MKPTYDTVIQPALERFNSAQSQQRCVALSSFYPADLGAAADYALLVQADPALVDFRYLYVGNWLVRMFDADPTGQLVADTLPDQQAQDALCSYSEAVTGGEPLIEQRRLVFSRFVPFGYFRLMLPMSDNGRDINHVLVYVVPNLWWARNRSDLRARSGNTAS
jgi:hypothetical protein